MTKNNMEKSNEKLLRSWLAKTLLDNFTILNNKEPVKVYAELEKIWLKEIQEAFKVIAKEFLKLKK